MYPPETQRRLLSTTQTGGDFANHPKKKTFHPKDHWTLKTGYFEDLPLLHRFVHPSIGGSKILRARIFLRSPDSKLWLGSWGVWPFCTMTSSLRRFLFLVLFELRVSGWIYTTVSVPHLPIEKIIPPNNARPVFYCFGRMIMKSLGHNLPWWQDVKCLDFNPQSQ